MARIPAGLLAFALAVVLTACGGSSAGSPSTEPTASPPPEPLVVRPGEPIMIGVSAALSGDQVNLGTDIADAVDLSASDFTRQVKGRALRTVRVDDGCTDVQMAVDAAHKLVDEEHVAGVIGPMCTTGAQAANRVYEDAGVAHILPTATRVDLSHQGGRYFFRLAWQDDAQAAIQVSFTRGTSGAATAMVIDDGEAYGHALADEFVRVFEEQGGRVLARERIVRGERDFAPLAREVLSAGPDAVVFEGLNPEGALVVKALRTQGYGGLFVAPDGLLSQRDFIDPDPPVAEGAIVTGGPFPSQSFAVRFFERVQRAPTTPFVLQAYDAFTVLAVAIEAIAEEDADGNLVIDRQRLADELRARQFLGLTGAIAFDERGDRIGDAALDLGLTVYRVTGGRFEAVP
jgi:branched-chain amino acid transport system substrate-binding protein